MMSYNGREEYVPLEVEDHIMETQEMGRVLVDATIENIEDAWEANRGLRAPGDVRRVTVREALVDTGATALSLPTGLIGQLGLKKRSEKRVTTSSGDGTAAVYDPVRLTIQDRECIVEVVEVPDSVPPLVGQVPLEMLDFVVDPQSRRLIGNPAHGGEHVLELY
jgi:predicted aspartyl protease